MNNLIEFFHQTDPHWESSDPRILQQWNQHKKRKDDFHYARDGDHIITPFQCDLRVFRCINNRNPVKGLSEDDTTLAFIWRANLESFWSHSPCTVNDNRSRAEQIIDSLDELGIARGPFHDLGPTEDYDSFRYTTAIAMLSASRRRRRNSTSHLQWSTIRHTRTTLSNHKRLGNRHLGSLALVDSVAGTTQHFQSGGTSSLWFQQFLQGCRARMGDNLKKNLALDVKLFKRVIDRIDLKARSATNELVRARWCVVGAYLSFSYLFSLRGNEGFMIDIKELIRNPTLKKGLV